MGLLQDFFKNRERKSLESNVTNRPSPESFVRYCEFLKKEGELDKAAEYARRGHEMFPNYGNLDTLFQDLEKVQLKHDAEKLEAQIARIPNKTSYKKLANVYIELKDYDKALEVCEAGEKNFPDYDAIYVSHATIYIMKNHENDAIKFLEKAIELDKLNYNAYSKLGNIYLHKGYFDKAKECFSEILKFAPDDENVKKLIEQTEASKRNTKTLGSRMDKEEEAEEEKSNQKEPEEIMNFSQSALRELKDAEGIHGVIVIDKQGLVVDSIMDVKLEEDLMAGLMLRAYNSTNDYSRQMGFGALEQGTIFAEHGNVHVLPARDLFLAVFSEPQVKLGFVERQVKLFVQRFIKEV